jgi:hypothetical protein
MGAALGWRLRRCGRDAHCDAAMADCRPFRESTCGYLANRSPTAPGGIRFLGAGNALENRPKPIGPTDWPGGQNGPRAGDDLMLIGKK